MTTNVFASVKPNSCEQNARVSQRPLIASRWFNGTKVISGTDTNTTPLPLEARRMRLFTKAGILIDETLSASNGTYSFPNLREDINDVSDGMIVTKQRVGVDGYAQMRDNILAV